ncbi:C4-dicarboxylate ABC transporter substrate-binding protein [candidate division GN15 bacterium]|nr:C4-dicarboxylate ABC transporter substrate-binding protein [candidate division GN15 bacterium]
MRRTLMIVLVLSVVVSGLLLAEGAAEQEGQPIRIVAATYLAQDHVFYKALERFKTQVEEEYTGDVTIELHHSGDLGSATDFFEFMMQGISVDVAFVAPSHMATWVPSAQFLDTPYLWQDYEHLESAYESDVLEPIEQDILDAGVRVMGYAGGGIRNMILNQAVTSPSELGDVLMRVMGAPIQARVFEAVGVQPTPMAYLEVYNAIKTGVIDGLENEASALVTQRFYEVASHVVLTEHAITVRPMLVSEARLQSWPEDLQEIILEAGADAANWAREQENASAETLLLELEDSGQIELHEINKQQLRQRALPVIEDFASELGLSGVYSDIRALE